MPGGKIGYASTALILLVATKLSWGQVQPAPVAVAVTDSLSEGGLRWLRQFEDRIPPSSQMPSARPTAPIWRSQAAGNVIVNDPSMDIPERTTQSETTLAVLGSTVCAGYNNTRLGHFPNSASGFARSADSGDTWTDEGVTAALWLSGDPALAAHRASGTFYYAGLANIGGYATTEGLVPIIAVQRSTDDCHSFLPAAANASPTAAPAAVCAGPAATACSGCRRNADCDSMPGANDGICIGPDFEDKPWIAVDNSGGPRDGAVYACWSRTVGAFPGSAASRGEVRFSRSLDGGMMFENDQAISPPGAVFPFGCHVDVGPDGEVYVAWSDRSTDYPIYFRRSLDGGSTWDVSVQVNTMPIREPGTDRITACGTTTICGVTYAIHRPTLNGGIRMLPQAWMAVDTSGGPFTGNVYVVWAHDPPGLNDNSDVLMSRSTDGGDTWSPGVQIGGDSPTDQFEPFVAVGGHGTVSLLWYDRRNDPFSNFNIDVYTAFSRDGGATVDAPVRLTDVSFPVPPLTGQPTHTGNFDPGASACYMGEYIATTADAERFYFTWGDNRNTIVSASYPRGRPDPDVFFARQPAPPLSFCVGNCNDDAHVTVDEVLTMVNIALGAAPLSVCKTGDANGDHQITVDEILTAVNNALNGCQPS